MINRAIALHTFQQHHWIRLSLLGLILLFVYLSANGMERFPLILLTPFFVWVLGSGIIGRDMSSGVAHLLFTRPITKRDYILTKWASLTIASWFFQILVLGVWAFGKLWFDKPFEPLHPLHNWQQDFGVALWMAATLSTVVVLLSTLMAGWGDLAMLLYIHVALFVLNTSSLKKHINNFDDFINWILRIVWPGVAIGFRYARYYYFDASVMTPSLPVLDIVIDSGIAVLFLYLAIVLISRKDISYTAE